MAGIKIRLQPYLTDVTGGQETVDVDGGTVGQCLAQLVLRYPKIKNSLFNPDGKLYGSINVYVNGENIYPIELAKELKGGDEVTLSIIALGG